MYLSGYAVRPDPTLLVRIGDAMLFDYALHRFFGALGLKLADFLRTGSHNPIYPHREMLLLVLLRFMAGA